MCLLFYLSQQRPHLVLLNSTNTLKISILKKIQQNHYNDDLLKCSLVGYSKNNINSLELKNFSKWLLNGSLIISISGLLESVPNVDNAERKPSS